MNIQELTKILINAGIEPNEAAYEVKMLVEHFCNYNEQDKILGRTLSNDEIRLLQDKIYERAKSRLPIQYIIGDSWFMGEFFKVTPDVLIPRDETEILVRAAIDLIKKNNFQTVLDIGTGSGCIACTIAKQTNAEVLGVDISNDALRIALDNVTRLGINNRAIFRKSDLFERIRAEEKFDLIISNPPYIKLGTKLDIEVEFEPAIALYAGKNGTEFYERIVKDTPNYIKPNGYLMFELGFGESETVKKYMEKDFSDIKIIKDMAGIDRVIFGKYV